MAVANIGRLIGADEQLNHQIADTFTTVVESDRGWMEKIGASFNRKDGGLQVEFWLGKYPNRNVMDGVGGVSRSREQWTVRASRALACEPEKTAVGPIRYEVVEPLKRIRFSLDENKVQPISFEVMFKGLLPPFFEERNHWRAGFRVSSNVIRYHQSATVSGWVKVNGELHEITDDTWYGIRDHSWGMRGDEIGVPPTDVEPGKALFSGKLGIWSPLHFFRPDGSVYEVHIFLLATNQFEYSSGFVNHLDGGQERIRRVVPKLKFDTSTRALLGGVLKLEMESGEVRRIEMETVGTSGFYVRTAKYGGWQGFRNGSWRGEYHEDGEYIPDCIAALPQLGQQRDCPVRVREGDAAGYGIAPTFITGNWPELGLGPESDFSIGM